MTNWREFFFYFLLSVPVMAGPGAGQPVAVPTFECVGLYWKAPGGAAPCEVRYRAAGTEKWNQALPLWFDKRDREYRGSIVNLKPGTTYDIELQAKGASPSASLQARTWPEAFPVGKRVGCPPVANQTLTISESGTPNAFILYEPDGKGSQSVIDVGGEADCCIVVKASCIVIRGLTLKGARVHGILLGEGAHDVVIENCDISGWGRIADDGWGKDYDAAIYSREPGVKRIIVQRNRIHHPRSNSNNWQQPRPAPGKREPSHPEGPQAVCLWDSEGNHVIRHNTVFSDGDHQYNDIFGAGHNFSTRGFPNRDSDIYGNLLSHCWDDAIESEGANCNVRIWGNYITESFVGVACASTSVGPLYVWRNVTGVIRESPTKVSGAFLKTSDKTGGGKVYVFHNTILQPARGADPNKASGAVVGLGWGGPMTNVTSRNNILHVTRTAISDRAHDPLGDYDYDLFSAPVQAGAGQEPHGVRGVPVYAPSHGIQDGKGNFTLIPQSPGFDAGEIIPNFNDGFAGSGPDLGAQEAGSPAMEFGAEAYLKTVAGKPSTRPPEPSMGFAATVPSWFPQVPPLPSPEGKVIRVGTAEELLAAVDRVVAGETILLADGRYRLSRPLVLGGKTNVALRSASADATKVTLCGRGWESGDQNDDLLRIGRCESVTVADLTFADCRSYGIKVEAENAPRDIHIRNCHFRDIGVRAIKGSAGQDPNVRAVKGSVRGCRFENTKVPPPEWLFGGDYIAAIDMMALEDWVFSENVFRNIKGRNGGGRAAIFIWVRSRRVVVEKNWITGCDRGIAFGNPGPSTANVAGGRLVYVSDSIIRNNFIAGGADCGIELWHVDQVKVLNNSIWRPEQNWNRGIRIGTGTTGLEVVNNLVHGDIQVEGGEASIHHNATGRLESWFAEPASGDLSLTAEAGGARGQGLPVRGVTEDIRGQPRFGNPDLGAWQCE